MGNEHPFFSIIVPTYAHPDRLATCLQALAQLEYPNDRFEVIVIDDGSPQSLESVVAPFRDRLDVTLIKQPNRGPAAARNTGAQQAKGEFLAFTDDDCAPAPDWLQTLAVSFVETSVCVLQASPNQKLRMVKKYQFKQAIVTVSPPNSDVKLKIVFVQNPEEEKWYAFAATNPKLSAEAILSAYSKRWRIEVYFKNSKQYFILAKNK